jgi:hypothetical protein
MKTKKIIAALWNVRSLGLLAAAVAAFEIFGFHQSATAAVPGQISYPQPGGHADTQCLVDEIMSTGPPATETKKDLTDYCNHRIAQGWHLQPGGFGVFIWTR